MSSDDENDDDAQIRKRIRELYEDQSLSNKERFRLIQLVRNGQDIDEPDAKRPCPTLSSASSSSSSSSARAPQWCSNSDINAVDVFPLVSDYGDGHDIARSLQEIRLTQLVGVIKNKRSHSRKLLADSDDGKTLRLSAIGQRWRAELAEQGLDEASLNYVLTEAMWDAAHTSFRVPAQGPCPAPLASCRYGRACYRKNPAHFQQFCHPGDWYYCPSGAGDVAYAFDGDVEASGQQPAGASVIERAAVFGCWQSDDLIDEALRAQLIEQIDRLTADVQARHGPDWHPGSGQRVLDVVHPSLHPFVAGLTRAHSHPFAVARDSVFLADDWRAFLAAPAPAAKADRDTAALAQKLLQYARRVQRHTGDGSVCTAECDCSEPPLTLKPPQHSQTPYASRLFQWLPADFSVLADGSVSIDSYINNLHPLRHAELYVTIARVFERAVPLFERVLADALAPPRPSRLAEPGWHEREWESDGELYTAETLLPPPVPERFAGTAYAHWLSELPPVNLRNRTLQVIVKLADVRLDPSKPAYSGSSWHVEGMRNEQIVATCIYYYDACNVVASDSVAPWTRHGSAKLLRLCWLAVREHRLDYSALPDHVQATKSTVDEGHTALMFRTNIAEPEDIPQNDDQGAMAVYGLENEGPLCQPRGKIATLPGRLVCFPNTLQHRVDDFEILRWAPGYRRIMLFWLVQPSVRVPGTSVVPPQQADWYEDDAPVPAAQQLLSMPEAKKLRKVLMAERKYLVHEYTREVVERQFSLCEH